MHILQINTVAVVVTGSIEKFFTVVLRLSVLPNVTFGLTYKQFFKMLFSKNVAF